MTKTRIGASRRPDHSLNPFDPIDRPCAGRAPRRPRRTLTLAWEGLLGSATFALAALWCLPAPAHETDQYTLPVGRQFADLGPHLSRIVHGAIVDAVTATNTQIERSLQDGRPTQQTARLQSPDFIAGKVWGELFAAFPTNEILDGMLVSQQTRVRYPGLVTGYRPEQSIHDDPLLLLDVTKVVRSLFRAGTVSVDGKSFGTDKIVHFIHLGHIYYSSYASARKRGVDESIAVDRAFQLSTGNNLLLSENWLLGTFTTGIRSNADLAANYAGFKFYRNLTEPVRIGNSTMAAMLVRRGLYWHLNEQTRPDSDFFTAFVTPHWNEALNPNVYAFGTRARMRTVLRSRCPDVLDWYRDEHGRRLSRRQFAEIEDELSTFYGEEYGYQDGGEEAVSIATTCFEAEPSLNARADPGDVDAGDVDDSDLHAQRLFGLQSGWGRHARGRGSAPAGSSTPGVWSSQPGVDELGRTQLWWAARDGRVEEVERMLAHGADPNAADVDGEGPLHAAARWGQAAVVEVLLARGADPGMQALHRMTPLQVAVLGAQVDATRALLEHGAAANVRDVFGSSPLHAATARGDQGLVALLLDYGADPAAADDSGTTPLQLATRTGNAAVVHALVSRATTRNARNEGGVAAYQAEQLQSPSGVLRQVTHAEQSGHALDQSPGNSQ